MFKNLMANTQDRITRRRRIMNIHKEMSDIRIQIKSAEEVQSPVPLEGGQYPECRRSPKYTNQHGG